MAVQRDANRDRYYQADGTSARVLYDPDYYARKARQEVEREEARVPEVRERAKPKASPLARLGAAVLVMVMFAMTFGVLYRQSKIETEVVELDDLREEVEQLQKRGEDLELELLLTYDISELRAWAQSAGFDYPEAEQVVALELPAVPQQAQQEQQEISADLPEEMYQSAFLSGLGKLLNW